MEAIINAPSLEDLLTLEELAEKLKVKKSWIYSQSRQTGPGSIPRVKVGKYLRFSLEDVMAWLQEEWESENSP